MKLQSKWTKSNLIHNHSIHHVFWKNAVHVILLLNPYTFKVSILCPSLHQGKYQEKNPTNSVKALLITLPCKPHLVIQSNVVISTLSIKTEIYIWVGKVYTKECLWTASWNLKYFSILYGIIYNLEFYIYPNPQGANSRALIVCLSHYYFKIYAMQIWNRSEHCEPNNLIQAQIMQVLFTELEWSSLKCFSSNNSFCEDIINVLESVCIK